MNQKGQSRRDFIKLSATGLAAISIVPSKVVSGLGHQVPSDKLNIAAIGAGGIGYKNLINMSTDNIVAIADVDWNYGEKSFRRWPEAKKYEDYRIMIEKEQSIDAVIIAIPDHSHALAAMTALQNQKHLYIQTPVAYSIYELQRITELSRVYNVNTQVGNQGASSDGTRIITENICAGAIGEVTKVDVYAPKPDWIYNIDQQAVSTRLPRELNWDLFVGPSKQLEYNSNYTPYLWRNFWQFSNGTIATLGAHFLEPVFRALKLDYPRNVSASSNNLNLKTISQTNKITFHFDERDNLPKVAMPKLKLNWYDGGLLPDISNSISNFQFLDSKEGGIIFYGTEGVLVANKYGENPRIIKNNEMHNAKSLFQMHRIEKPLLGGHEQDFIRACKESPENRLDTSANLYSQNALNETLLLGSLAIKLQSLNKTLEWDHDQQIFSNIGITDEIVIENNEGVYFDKGIAKTRKKIDRYNAKQFVDQAIRPIYRTGFKQI